MIPFARMSDHDRDLVQWSIRNCDFVGGYGGNPDSQNGCTHYVNRRKLTEHEVKMFNPDNLFTKAPLLDDSTSGGADLVPVEFDAAVILTPLLFGQLFPMVEVVDIARGNVIQGGTVGNPTFGYTAEGTGITPFDATNYVGAFNNTIYPSTGAMDIGRDFQQDSPAAIGAIVIKAFGNASMNWLDNVLATGNGTNQPQGMLTFATPITCMPENPTQGPVAIADLETLLAAMPLAYQQAEGARLFYLGTQTTYQRYRGIPVSAEDSRRVLGLDERSYQVLGIPFKINSTVTNNQLSLVNGGGYRLYRRRRPQHGRCLGRPDQRVGQPGYRRLPHALGGQNEAVQLHRDHDGPAGVTTKRGRRR